MCQNKKNKHFNYFFLKFSLHTSITEIMLRVSDLLTDGHSELQKQLHCLKRWVRNPFYSALCERCVYTQLLRNKGRRKKKLRPSPLPLELIGHIFWGIFFLELQKKLFFLSGQALTLPPLSGRATLKKKQNIFCSLPKLCCTTPGYYQMVAQNTIRTCGGVKLIFCSF